MSIKGFGLDYSGLKYIYSLNQFFLYSPYTAIDNNKDTKKAILCTFMKHKEKSILDLADANSIK